MSWTYQATHRWLAGLAPVLCRRRTRVDTLTLISREDPKDEWIYSMLKGEFFLQIIRLFRFALSFYWRCLICKSFFYFSNYFIFLRAICYLRLLLWSETTWKYVLSLSSTRLNVCFTFFGSFFLCCPRFWGLWLFLRCFFLFCTGPCYPKLCFNLWLILCPPSPSSSLSSSYSQNMYYTRHSFSLFIIFFFYVWAFLLLWP